MRTANRQAVGSNFGDRLLTRKPTDVGMISLPAGVLLYISNPDINFCNSAAALPGQAGRYLPSFPHAFALVMITAGLIGKRQRADFQIFLFWPWIEVLRELEQHVNGSITSVSSRINGISCMGNTEYCLIYGALDWNNVAAMTVGAVVAYRVLRVTNIIERGVS